MRLAFLIGNAVYPSGHINADGDSITRGAGLDPTAATRCWFGQMVDELGPELLDFTAYNSGVDSETVLQMTANAASQIDTRFTANARLVRASAVPCINFLFGGTNDLYFGADETTVRARQIAYLAARRAAHPTAALIFGIMLPRGGTNPPLFDTYRDANVAWWMNEANWSAHCDEIVPWHLDALALDPDEYPDDVHPGEVLHARMGRHYAANAVRRVLGLSEVA